MQILSPLAFVVSSLVIYWVGWSTLAKTIPIVVVGLIWYAVTYVVNHDTVADLMGGIWLIAYLVAEYILSKIGSFDGLGWIPSPLDSAVVAVMAMVVYAWGVRSGVSYMRGRPDEVNRLREESEADYEAATAAAP